MKTWISKAAAAAALFASSSLLRAQPKVHPFEQPPRLKESSKPGPLLSAFSIKAPGPQNCEPRGSITRDGNIVWAKLHLMRADFTINNPDPTDPYKGEDPVTLRSYGGCKAGPVIEVLPGNTLRVDLINSLDANDPTCLPTPPPGLSLPPGVGCFNTTNLHT